MRLISLVVLVAVVAAVVIFAVGNEDEVPVRFLQWEYKPTVAQLVGAVYVLGMITGWAVVGLLRRSWVRVTEPVYRQPVAR